MTDEQFASLPRQSLLLRNGTRWHLTRKVLDILSCFEANGNGWLTAPGIRVELEKRGADHQGEMVYHLWRQGGVEREQCSNWRGPKHGPRWRYRIDPELWPDVVGILEGLAVRLGGERATALDAIKAQLWARINETSDRAQKAREEAQRLTDEAQKLHEALAAIELAEEALS